MPNDYHADATATPPRAPYERPVVIELNLAGCTHGKAGFSYAEFYANTGPS